MQNEYHFQTGKTICLFITLFKRTRQRSQDHRYRVERIGISKRNRSVKSNMTKFGDALDSLKRRIDQGEIIIKTADKGDLTTVMPVQYYYDMCMRELGNKIFYQIIGTTDPGESVHNIVKDFATRHKYTLTNKEYNYLVHRKYRRASFYVLPNSESRKKGKIELQTSHLRVLYGLE